MDASDHDNRFAYHKPKDNTTVRAHERIRLGIGAAAKLVDVNVPEGREKALAYTKLEEAMMWANAGIARNQ